MPKTQKMGSIGGRINRLWVWKLFWIFFWMNILLFAVAIHANGGFSAYPMTGGFRLFWDLDALQDEFRTHAVIFIPLFILQGLILLWQLIFGARRVRRRLMPLYEMAQTAEKLGAQVDQDEEKFQTLETAISNLSPYQADQLETGDSELAGLEHAINNLLERMRENYRQQSRFVGDASHELRTPIAVIQGYVNMLDRWGKEDEKVLEESIAAIQSESAHMQHLVEQLLFLARGDIGQIQIEEKPVDLKDMMQEVYDESKMINDAYTYRLDLPDEPVETVGDAGLIKQVARILTENAVKYSEAGTRITLRAGQNQDGTVYFQIQDEGAGMKAEDLPHIFERFYRSDSSRTKATGGTGLGLSIAKWIIDKHRGYFDVRTWEDIGTRVTVNLPGR